MDIFNLLLLISKLITIMLTTKLAIQFYKQGGFKIKGFHKMNISGKNEALKQADGPKYNKLVKDTKPYFVGVIPEQYRTERDRKAQPPKDLQKKKTVEKKSDIEKKKLNLDDVKKELKSKKPVWLRKLPRKLGFNLLAGTTINDVDELIKKVKEVYSNTPLVYDNVIFKTDNYYGGDGVYRKEKHRILKGKEI